MFSFQNCLRYVSTANMSSSQGVLLCHDAFFDRNLTWDTDDPELSDCMNDTLLVAIPCLVLYLLAPICFKFASRSRAAAGQFPSTTSGRVPKMLMARVVFMLALAATTFCEFASLVNVRNDFSQVLCVADVIRVASLLLTLVAAGGVAVYEAKIHLSNSATLPLFWLSLALCNLGRVKTHGQLLLSSTTVQTAHQQALSLAVIASFFIVLLQLILSCFSGRKVHGEESPEYATSFFGAIYFSWYEDNFPLNYMMACT